MEIGRLESLAGKTDLTGFILDVEFKSAAAMQGHIGMLKTLSAPLMMNHGQAYAAVVVSPTRMLSFYTFETEADWHAFDAAMKVHGMEAIGEHWIEATASVWGGAFGAPTTTYLESIAAWDSIPHFNCAIRKVCHIATTHRGWPTGSLYYPLR